MQEMVLGVRSSAWSKKGLTLGDQPQAIEFGAKDPDAEIVRIQEHLKSIGVDLPKRF